MTANLDPDWEYQPLESEIYKVPLDGGAPERVTRRVGPDFSPALSPDGRHLAYVGFDDKRLGYQNNELNVLDTPITSRNFVELARNGFFTGMKIHRVVPTFVVQAGDQRGDGEGGPGYVVPDELTWQPYLRGTVGMALDWRDTAGSQWFIALSPQPHLDGRYTVFARVVNGWDVLDRLSQWDVIERVRIWDGVTFN